jgi:hypothetical protein
MIRWAEKYGSLASETNSTLKTLNEKLNKPFYQTWEFWQTAVYIVLFVAGLFLIVFKGGCFSIKGFIELGLCKNL